MREILEEYGAAIICMILGIAVISALSYIFGDIVSGNIWRHWYI